MRSKYLHRCNCPEHPQKQTCCTPVDPMFNKFYTSVQWSKPQNPNRWESYSPVDPTQQLTSVGLTGDRKKSDRAQKRNFPARNLWKSRWFDDQFMSKGAQILGRWRWWLQEHIPKRFKRRSSRIKRNRRNRSKSGVFSRTQKTTNRKNSWILGIWH